jgi:mannan endo-1,4-beta-mannosidase
MQNKFKLVCVLGIILLLGGIATLGAQGFSISGRNLIDANGNTFILRGTSHAHCWYTDKTTQALADIKSLGGNCVRIVCSNGREGWTPTTASDLTNIINTCKSNKLIAILEDHDTTGYGENSNAVSLMTAASYWNSVKSVLTGQEAYVIIDIGNEPYGNTNPNNWVNDMNSAISSMRNNGFNHTLMIDAPNWGQDNQSIMLNNAASMLAADPKKNLYFAVHMYEFYGSGSTVTTYINNIVSKNLPVCVGEFGPSNNGQSVDVETIFSSTQSNNIGYMSWSWCGNGSCCTALDEVNNWDKNNLTSWGSRAFNGTNGIKSTSRECSVFGGPVTTAVPPVVTPVVTAAPTTAPGCPCTLGDPNCSGTIDIVDGLLIAQYYVGITPSNFTVCACDVNRDGSCDIVDALKIAQCYVGLVSCNF